MMSKSLYLKFLKVERGGDADHAGARRDREEPGVVAGDDGVRDVRLDRDASADGRHIERDNGRAGGRVLKAEK